MAKCKCVPVPGTSGITTPVIGRQFALGRIADIDQNDMALQSLGASGFAVLPPHGPSSQRPTQYFQGKPWCDDSLQEVIFALVYPLGSNNVVGWCDMNGNSV